MEYTVQKLAQIAGISTRTLRYYDEIGILKPARINSSGYRIYGQMEVNRLQQILFYKALGVNLKTIKGIIQSPGFDEIKALHEHRGKLLDKREQLNQLIVNVNKTIAAKERSIIMSDKEKFEGFKSEIIEENENTYGQEIRLKYGEEVINNSNKRLKNMTKENYEKVKKIENEVLRVLQEAFETGNPASELAQKSAELHRQWLSFFWSEYSKKAHAGLAQMYVDDERFAKYYDKKQHGMAKFLRDAIFIYTGVEK
ncbi:MerR family transcriptional regulator [Natranaerovirga hydrolytica]|uniref:MerR family transcriptional regulator n=1 Tax=Natranaerovirga hydrolytica TaxID=680378 RepID=A0A4R1MZA3_9FIRM|nr:MerR family transcriptional regulator [Natranaerovirga hydrolytica]TCK98505.1 MerR family transcriptional regulator [Natranaerovirga hydrolytica]